MLFESLEQRQMMATGLTASLGDDGVLAITGTEQADNIIVRQIDDRISVDGLSDSHEVRKIERIVVDARGGDDTVNLDSGSVSGQEAIAIPAVIDGGSGNDVIYGSAARDVVFGGDGWR